MDPEPEQEPLRATHSAQIRSQSHFAYVAPVAPTSEASSYRQTLNSAMTFLGPKEPNFPSRGKLERAVDGRDGHRGRRGGGNGAMTPKGP